MVKPIYVSGVQAIMSSNEAYYSEEEFGATGLTNDATFMKRRR